MKRASVVKIKSRTVNISEIMNEDNPRLCLSPLRYLEKCHECPQFVSSTGKPCNSRIVTENMKAKIEAIEGKKARIKELKAELKRLRENV